MEMAHRKTGKTNYAKIKMGMEAINGNLNNRKYKKNGHKNNNQIALFYSNENGEVNETSNPNGSSKNIAGVFNKDKNILGMMPHPERMIDVYLSSDDGSIFFENLINNLK